MHKSFKNAIFLQSGDAGWPPPSIKQATGNRHEIGKKNPILEYRRILVLVGGVPPCCQGGKKLYEETSL
jgi:hypothetical protein